MYKISIVVPVYNIEKYIGKCIDSIISQTYHNYELILVDDGSKDGSANICDEYAKNNKNIKVIHKSNGGLSDARNAGINEATGDYVIFVDGDDFIKDSDCLQYLASELEKEQVDLLQYKMVHYYENTEKMISLGDYNCDNSLDSISKLSTLISKGTYSPSACDKIIKLSVIKENEIYFEKGLTSEDIKWSFKLFLNINKFNVVDREVYVYRKQRQGSITNTISRKNIECLYQIIKYWMDYRYESEEYKKVYYNYLAYQYVILLTLMDRKNTDQNLRKNIYDLRYLLKNDSNFKVKMSNKVFRIMGIRGGICFLKLYNRLKNRGIIKI